MKTLRVYKTLVIGLGSTGTRILDALAERIEWELGSSRRAPWVQFLALETDPSLSHRLDPDDFRPLCLSGTEYGQILTNPEAYDESIALTKWADLDTLRKLPSGAIMEGAGHIRMVGRLALLYPNNFRMVRAALEQRMSQLRNLTVASANQTLNEGVTQQSSFEVSIADHEAIRIFVVGTLSGGTCSGTAGDMGILLRSLTQKENERILGIFSIPHPQHNNSVANAKGLAEEHKANAYHALIELNQYQNYTDLERFKDIRYPDYPHTQPVLRPDQLPYDVIYLVRPRENTQEDQERLIQVVADRIFLNVFVPEADPMAEVVNGGIADPKEGLTFNFASFGMASIEYPVRRIVEAAKCRVMAHALREWKDRKVDLDVQAIAEQELKLTPKALLEDLLLDEGGSDVRQQLQAKYSELLRAAQQRPEDAEKVLREWRSAFERPGEGLKGIVTRTVMENRTQTVQRVMQRVLAQVQKQLGDYYAGPAPLEALLNEVRRQLSELRQWSPKEVRSSDVDSLLQRMRSLRSNSLLRFFLLHGKAVERVVPKLRKAIQDEEQARLERKLAEVFQDGPNGRHAEPGLITLLEEQVERVQRRLSSLRLRLDLYYQELNNRYLQLDGRGGAEFNGLALYRPGPGGTLEEELGKLLEGKAMEDLARRLVASWSDLPHALVPSGGQDWLRESPTPTEPPFPKEWTQRMEELALSAFAGLRASNKSLEDRLRAMASPSFNPEKEAYSAAQKASLFLPVDDALGQRSPDRPIMPRKLLLARETGELLRRALQSWRNTLPPAREVKIEDPFRLVMLEEKHKFSLRGALEIINVLGGAKATTFPTYFTRRRLDIDWTPISDKERLSLAEAQQRLLMALVHGVVRPEGGRLVLDWPERLGIKETRRYLPNTLAKAARMLAFAREDTQNLPIPDAAAVLKGRVDQAIENLLKTKGPHDYVKELGQALLGGSFRALKDWNTKDAVRAFMAWHRDNHDVLKAVLEVFPPDPVMIQRLWKEQGEPRPKGGYFDRPGYYCLVCGGPVGSTLEEAAAKAFTCDFYPEDPDHPFTEPYSVFQGLEGVV